MAACRSCGAEVLWAITINGTRMPVDPQPVDGGNVLLTRTPHSIVATVVGKRVQPSLFGDDGPRYTSHFATCPNANEHRRTR